MLITMLTSLEKLREPAAFWGWVNSITANRCKNLLTREPKEWHIPEDEEGSSTLKPPLRTTGYPASSTAASAAVLCRA